MLAGGVGVSTLSDDDASSPQSFAQLETVECSFVVDEFPDGSRLVWCPPPATTTTTTTVAATTSTTTSTTLPATTTTTRPPATTTTTTTLTPTTTTSTTLPPPASRPVMVGANISANNNPAGCTTATSCTTSFETQIGAPVEIARRFASNFPSTFSSVAAFAADINRRDRFISVKGEPTAAQWTTFLNSIPVDGFDTYVTINHEPENDGDGMTPVVFKSKLALMLSRIQLTGRQDIHPGFVLMAWTERNDGNSEDWFPDAVTEFTYGIDAYDSNGDRSLEQQAGPSVLKWKMEGGGPYFITETGTKQTGSAGVAWIEQGFAWCRADPDCLGPMWFHAATGAEGPWWLPTGSMSTTYGDQFGIPR